MKKILMTLAAVLCCAMATTVFTACGNDDDDNAGTFSYTIYVEPISYSSWTTIDQTDDGLKDWMNSIFKAYETALGVSSDKFTLNGKQADCDKKVNDACKKAEATVSTIKGGSANVSVINNTTGKTVYSYRVQP